MRTDSREAGGVRQALIELLQTGDASPRLQTELERHRSEGHPVHSWILSILTSLEFPEAEAKRHWTAVKTHRNALRKQLGRDVGVRVALLDYFANVNRELKNPKVVEIAIYERTERSAVTDGLTGLYNHAYFVQALKREVLRARRYDLRLSVVMLDLDNFKAINDTRGHREGDRILVKTAGIVEDSLREIDVAARYGGEEFTLILPDTPPTGAHVVAERIRQRIEEHFRRSRRGTVTISGGIASFPDDATSAEGLVERADEGLYQSKRAGKNRLTLIGGERRRHTRVSVRHAATVAGGSRRRAARAKNLSEGGLLLSLKDPVPVGSTLDVVLRPPQKAPHLDLRAEVVRVTPAADRGSLYDVGLRLLGDPEQARLAMKRGHA